MAEPPDHLTPHLDAADRLERVINAQSATLDRSTTSPGGSRVYSGFYSE